MSARREEKTTEFYGLLGSMALTERSDGGKACPVGAGMGLFFDLRRLFFWALWHVGKRGLRVRLLRVRSRYRWREGNMGIGWNK